MRLFSNHKYKTGGFTLIELLVVIAIFSLLASFVTSRTWETQKDARDVQRKRDISSLRSAVSVFRDQQDRWPANLQELENTDIMTTPPLIRLRRKPMVMLLVQPIMIFVLLLVWKRRAMLATRMFAMVQRLVMPLATSKIAHQVDGIT